MKKWTWAITIVMLWLLFAQALSAARAASITFDEGPHLAVGYTTLRTRDFRLQPVHIHPPLANALAAAPLLLDPSLPDPRAVDGWEINSLSAITDAVVWQNPNPARLAFAGRLPIILLTLVGAAVVWRWATDFAKAGLLALALYALDPNIVAHGSLVTTDVAATVFGLLAFFLLHRYLHRPTRARRVGIGLALGLGLASKVSAVLPVLVVGGLLLLKRRGRGVRDGLVVGLVAFVVVWAVYGFELRPVTSFDDSTELAKVKLGTLPLPAATHIEIYRSLEQHYDVGHPAFLMGQNSDRGWWHYFPVAFAIKTPLPALILFGAALAHLIHRRRPPDLTLWLYPLLYPLTALFSSVNIGYRHLLPVLPFLYIFIASNLRDAYAVRAPRITHYVSRFTFYALLVWLVIGTVRVHPYPLTFFNELAGGPDGGYRWLADSNLDWGQNLWDLRDWMRENEVEHVYYSHYSPARPEVYGIRADRLPPDPHAVSFAPLDPAPGWYAIGATTLQGAYTPDVNTFAWFRGREPDAVLGRALFLFRVQERPKPAWAAVCFGFPLDAAQIQAGLDAPNLRLVYYDCAASQVHPAGDAGRYLLPPQSHLPHLPWRAVPGSKQGGDGGALSQPQNTNPLAGATPDLQARHADGTPAYAVWNALEPPAPQRREIVPLDGLLTFLGYDDVQNDARPDQTIRLRTYWQVEGAPARPLSLMAHLIGPDGAPVAVGDGLGFPVEQWQPGDLIVQQHSLAVPAGTPPGTFILQTGVYWLDSGERWPTPVGDDKILLDKITILD